jgi:serine/threonine protein kinase
MKNYKKYLNDNYKLGKGTFGRVYAVKDENGKLCALKQ